MFELTDADRARFRFAPRKAFQSISLLLGILKGVGFDGVPKSGKVDIQRIWKACYLADKRILNERGVPMFGGTYVALEKSGGPAVVEIMEMLKCDPKWLSVMANRSGSARQRNKEFDSYTWEVDGRFIELRKGVVGFNDCYNVAPAAVWILIDAFREVIRMSEDELENHPEFNWKDVRNALNIRDGNLIHWEDMVADDHPNREELLKDMRELGPLYHI